MLFQSQTTAEPIAAMRRFVIPVLSYDELFLHPKRSLFVAKFAPLSKLNQQQFESVYVSTIKNYAEFVQLIPSDKRGVWGSLLDRGLMRAEFALSHIDQADENADDCLFRYALFSAALYMDLGKMVTKHDIYFCAENGELKEQCQLFDKVNFAQGKFYRVFPKQEALAKLRHLVTPILARQICPEACFLWLAQDLKLLTDWLNLLQGDFAGSGTLGKILALVRLEDENSNTLTDNILPRVEFEPRIALATKIADEFLDWLVDKIDQNQLLQNNDDLKIYNNQLWLNILALQRLAQEFLIQKPQYKNWQAVFTKIMALPMISQYKDQTPAPENLKSTVLENPKSVVSENPKSAVAPVLDKNLPDNISLQKNQKIPWFEPRQKGMLKSVAQTQNQMTSLPLQENTETKIVKDEKKKTAKLSKQEIATRMVAIPMHLISFGSTPDSVVAKRNLDEAEQKRIEKMLRKENKNKEKLEKIFDKLIKHAKTRAIIHHYLKKH